MALPFLPLPVVRSGTADVESLASYFHRLRVKNLGSTGRWLGQVSQPLTPTSQGARNIRLLGNVNTYDGALVRWLHQQGCPSEVLNLGAHRAAGWLRSSSFRRGRAWCPTCLHEDGSHEKMLWTLVDYAVCSEHRVPLEEVCAHCGWRARFVSSHAHQPGHCDQCTQSLARHAEPEHSMSDWDLHRTRTIRRWVTAYQQSGVPIFAPPWPISGLPRGQAGMTALLHWSWITGLDVIDSPPIEQPKAPHPTLAPALLLAMNRIGAPGLASHVPAALEAHAAARVAKKRDRSEYQKQWMRQKRARNRNPSTVGGSE